MESSAKCAKTVRLQSSILRPYFFDLLGTLYKSGTKIARLILDKQKLNLYMIFQVFSRCKKET